MHPNLCTICEDMFAKVMKSKQLPFATTILFADIRGFTDLSQHVESSKLHELLHHFYDHCSEAIWERDGIINKFIGDAVLAIFNFPLVREHHVANAINAALHLQQQCKELKKEIGLDDVQELGVGIGIHTGECFMGEVGTVYKDFTAIGPVVNLASRLQGAAGPGEIVMTAEVFNHVKDQLSGARERALSLKGIDGTVNAFVLG